MPKFLRTIGLSAIVLALPVMLIACGDDDDEPEATAPPAATNTMEPDNGNGDGDGEEATADIVDTAVAAGSFETLVTAVTAAELVETLKGPGPFTVFAPTDDAFAALPDGTVEGLLEDQEALTNVLTYHVVSGEVTSDMLSDGMEVEMLNGDMLTISIDGGTVMIGDATVTTADVETSNGVIHIIDTVLVPAE